MKKIEGNLNGIFKKARRMRLCDIDLSIVYENIREDTPKSSFKPTPKDLETSRDKALSFKECEMLRTFAKDSTKLVDKALALMTYLPDRLAEITAIRKGDISKDFAFIDVHATIRTRRPARTFVRCGSGQRARRLCVWCLFRQRRGHS